MLTRRVIALGHEVRELIRAGLADYLPQSTLRAVLTDAGREWLRQHPE